MVLNFGTEVFETGGDIGSGIPRLGQSCNGLGLASYHTNLLLTYLPFITQIYWASLVMVKGSYYARASVLLKNSAAAVLKVSEILRMQFLKTFKLLSKDYISQGFYQL